MRINIFQIDGEKDKHGVMYQHLDAIEGFQGTKDIQSEIYDKVFDGDVDCNTLEGVYTMFNTDHPQGYVGRSLSVSDIVQVCDGGEEEVGFYFCDSFGFKKVEFDPTKTVERNNKAFQDGMQDKRINAGYEIIKSFPVGNTEFVLGENIHDRARYVTWECTGGNNYFWGHYFTDKEAANKDLYDRVEAEVVFKRSIGECPKESQ